jgi:hypothetical protein
VGIDRAGETGGSIKPRVGRGFAQKVRIQSCEAGRLTIAQHFSAGIRTPTANKSAKRTTEILRIIQPSVSRTGDFLGLLLPALKCCAIVIRRLRRLIVQSRGAKRNPGLYASACSAGPSRASLPDTRRSFTAAGRQSPVCATSATQPPRVPVSRSSSLTCICGPPSSPHPS